MADKPFYDKRGRLLPIRQLAAIFAKSERLGISDTVINATKLTSLNDEIIEGRSNKEDENKVLDRALRKHFNVKPKIIKTEVIPVENIKLPESEINLLNPKGKQMKVIDLIRKFSVTNGIDHAEARRLLEMDNLIPPGISDDANLKPKIKDLNKLVKLTDSPKSDKPRFLNEVKAPKEDVETAKRIIERIDSKKEVKRKISDARIMKIIDETKELKEEQKSNKKIMMGTLDQASNILGIIQRVEQQDLSKIDENEKLIKQLEGKVLDVRKDLESQNPRGITEEPLGTPGLVSGVNPLEESLGEKTTQQIIQRRALDIVTTQGKSPQEAMRQARLEFGT